MHMCSSMPSNKLMWVLIIFIVTFYSVGLWTTIFNSQSLETHESKGRAKSHNGYDQGNERGNAVSEAAIIEGSGIFINSFSPVKELGSLKERQLEKPLVLMYTKLYDSKVWPGLDKCPEKCQISTDKNMMEKADLVLFQGWKKCNFQPASPHGLQCVGWDEPWEIWDWPGRLIKGQVWLYAQLESQQNSANGRHLAFVDNIFNYTRTFKKDSTISFPYGETLRVQRTDKDYYFAKGKSGLILWLVSHCNVELRDAYVRELGQYVQIDEFGKCSGKKDGCSPSDDDCVRRLKRKYKFYIAFENSICDEYVTEKFWQTLYDGMVPIALGTDMDFYRKVAPPDSFLHVDNFTSPKHLAEYINYLGSNDAAYDRYQEWRQEYSAEPGWVQHACEVCRLASEKPPSVIKLSEYWNMNTQCRNITESFVEMHRSVPVIHR